MIPKIFLIFVLGTCHGLDDFNSRTWKFSLDLMNSRSFDNMAIAPFNLWCLLAGAGLWTNGESKEQILKVLKLPNNKTLILNEYLNLKKTIFDDVSLGVLKSNGIFIYTSKDFDVVPEFRETMITYFGAVIETLNFEDPRETVIKANDLIKNKLDLPVTVFRPEDFINTKMIMSNVISFNGFWKSLFNFSHTTIESYSLINSTDVYHVKMMHKTLKLPYSTMNSLNASIMELTIGFDGKFSLLLIMPYQGMDIREVYQKLYGVTITDILDKLQNDVSKFGMREVNLTLPRVKIETSIVLNKPLNDIGLKDVFNSEKSDFLGISKDDIYVSSIDHVCTVFIVETGVYIKSNTPGYYDHAIPTSDLPAKQPFIFFVIQKSTKNVMAGGFYTKASSLMTEWPV